MNVEFQAVLGRIWLTLCRYFCDITLCILDRAKPLLLRLFLVLPRSPYNVRPLISGSFFNVTETR